MATTLLNIARCGLARCGLARLNYGEARYVAEAGGLAYDGSAIVSGNSYRHVADGGLGYDGAAGSKAGYEHVADGGLGYEGAAGSKAGYKHVADGGLGYEGAASSKAGYKHVADGGLGYEGAASSKAGYKHTADGGLAYDGTAAPFLLTLYAIGSGGLAYDGAAGSKASYKFTADGGMGFDGSASIIFTIDRAGLPVFIRRFDGDVRLALSDDGGIIKIRGGQPEMDGGLETAVNISLLSQGDWWGNALAAKGEEIGSTFLDALRAPLTNQARLDIIEAARRALAWMLEAGIANAVDVTATIPATGRLSLTIAIRQPEKAPNVFRYTVNWQNQRITLEEAA